MIMHVYYNGTNKVAPPPSNLNQTEEGVIMHSPEKESAL